MFVYSDLCVQVTGREMRLNIKRKFRVLFWVFAVVIVTEFFFKQIIIDTSQLVRREPMIEIISAKPRNQNNSDKESLSKSVPSTRFPSLPTDGHTVHRRFVEMKYGPVYIFGAAAGNSSPYASWDLMKIYGGLDRGWYNKSKFRCCLAYKDDGKVNLVKVFPARARGFMVSSAIWSLHVTCFNVKHDEKMVPFGAALTIDGYNCSRDHVRYVSPYFPQRETSEKVAIGTKTAYGNISAELIIEWMEAWRYIGVDKVIAFYIKSINEKALRVLQYYVSTGILDLYFYEPAASGKYPRDTYGDHFQRQNDQQIVVNDSFERMSGYRYFGIFDFDEFLTLAEGANIKEMMSSLYRMYPNATGVTFMSHYFFLSWGRSSNINDMIIGSYVQSNRPKFDNYKSLYMPERVSIGGVDTHTIKGKDGYKMYRGKYPCFGLVHHYRYCRRERMTECMNEYERLTDTSMAKWSLQFQKNVLSVRETVFGSTDVP